MRDSNLDLAYKDLRSRIKGVKKVTIDEVSSMSKDELECLFSGDFEIIKAGDKYGKSFMADVKDYVLTSMDLEIVKEKMNKAIPKGVSSDFEFILVQDDEDNNGDWQLGLESKKGEFIYYMNQAVRWMVDNIIAYENLKK
jgi:hypothetical protein